MRTRASDRRALVAALVVAAGVLTAGATGRAVACGHCVEDKVAATYDYGVVTHARAAGHRVYVFDLRGRVRPGDEPARRAVAAAVAGAPGVDPGTVRVALDPPAVSCACAPGAHPATSVPAAVAAALRPRGLSLRYLATADR